LTPLCFFREPCLATPLILPELLTAVLNVWHLTTLFSWSCKHAPPLLAAFANLYKCHSFGSNTRPRWLGYSFCALSSLFPLGKLPPDSRTVAENLINGYNIYSVAPKEFTYPPRFLFTEVPRIFAAQVCPYVTSVVSPPDLFSVQPFFLLLICPFFCISPRLFPAADRSG